MTTPAKSIAAQQKRAADSAEKKSANPGLDFSSIRTEVDLVVLGLLMNLGFLKVTEISTFISQISAGVTTNNLLVIVGVGAVIIAYAVYALSIAAGLVFVFNRKSARIAMIVALSAFFVVYVLVFFNSASVSQVGPPHRAPDDTAATIGLESREQSG